MPAQTTLTIDGLRVVLEDEKNLLEVIRKAHIVLPTFCYHSELSVYGACRLCMVEVEGRGLVSACSTPPEPGMKVRTQTPQVRELRKINVELLLASGDHHCATCGKSGACKLQSLAEQLGVQEVRFHAPVAKQPLDTSSPSLVRDPSKCILCGDCVRFCEEIQGIGALGFTHRGSRATVAPAFHKGLAEVDCVNCGQCAVVCPVGAITVKQDLERVFDALGDSSKTVVVQVAPAVRAAIGEAFNLAGDAAVVGRTVAALRRLGFDRVYDTSFTADLTIWEEATEFLGRHAKGEKLPLFTSCCPAWVKLAEHNLPGILDHLSTCRSPQAMFGSLAKALLPEQLGIEAASLVVVSVMPCTAKKFEAARPELGREGRPETDLVITTRELVRMIQDAGILFGELPVESFDLPFGYKTGAGVIFANSGGVTEAVVRYAARALASDEALIQEVRSDRARRVFELPLPEGGALRMAVVHGLAEARRLVKEIEQGDLAVDFVEVMACPGGCIGGAGQPVTHAAGIRRQRAEAIRCADAALDLRAPQDNHFISELYRTRLESPGSPSAHHLLHTHYQSRKRIAGDSIPLSEEVSGTRIPVSFCLGTACHNRGAQALLQGVLAFLDQESLAEVFDVRGTFCFEQCDRGPTVRVGGSLLHRATLASVQEALLQAAGCPEQPPAP